MDYVGLARRVFGLGGLVLVYLGVKDQAAVDAASTNLTALIGAGMALLDFGYSVFHKLTAK